MNLVRCVRSTKNFYVGTIFPRAVEKQYSFGGLFWRNLSVRSGDDVSGFYNSGVVGAGMRGTGRRGYGQRESGGWAGRRGPTELAWWDWDIFSSHIPAGEQRRVAQHGWLKSKGGCRGQDDRSGALLEKFSVRSVEWSEDRSLFENQ